MRSLRFMIMAGLILSAVSAFGAWPQTMSVQIRNGQIRATPSYLGQVVTALNYGDQVQVTGQQGDWMNVTGPGGKAGWMHSSALSKKKIVMKAGADDVETSASGDELALAGKGFNSDVEAEFKAKNKNVDFKWVDRMEKMKVTPQEMTDFLKEGQVVAAGGGR